MGYQVRVAGFGRQAEFRVGNKVVSKTPVLLDLDDGRVRRSLGNERGRFIVLPDMQVTFQIRGNVGLATTASGHVWRAPRACKLYAVTAQVGTAPATTTLIFDIHKIAAGGAATAAGTTVFTTQSRRPTVPAAGTVSTLSATAGVPEVQDIAEGDLLRLEIDQLGTGTVGADAVVQLHLY
jgi:hypothetical protein